MSLDVLSDLNWLAVLAAALAYFAIGAVWYAPPLFGKAWAAAGGLPTPDPSSRPSPAIYLTPLIGSVLSAVALALIAKSTDTDTFLEGIVVGLVVAIGFVSITFVTAQFESEKAEADGVGRVHRGYHVVGNLVAASWQ
jgi:hypothetical protein